MAEKPLIRSQVTEAAPADACLVQAQDIPEDTVKVSSGVVMLSDNAKLTAFSAVSSSSAIAANTTLGKIRWDLVCIDLTHPTAVLKTSTDAASLKGTEVAASTPWYTGVNAIPANYFPLAAILIDEVAPALVEITASDIIDTRGFFHKIG